MSCSRRKRPRFANWSIAICGGCTIAIVSKAIAASRYGDTVGVPALFDRSCFSELLAIDDEAGAKKIILQNRERVTEFAFPPGKIDIDTWSDYERLTNEM